MEKWKPWISIVSSPISFWQGITWRRHLSFPVLSTMPWTIIPVVPVVVSLIHPMASTPGIALVWYCRLSHEAWRFGIIHHVCRSKQLLSLHHVYQLLSRIVQLSNAALLQWTGGRTKAWKITQSFENKNQSTWLQIKFQKELSPDFSVKEQAQYRSAVIILCIS